MPAPRHAAQRTEPNDDWLGLRAGFRHTRAISEALAARLSAEDQTVQSMPDASPTKWHLAHTTWFFETFLLTPFLPGYRPFDDNYGYLFNSYYESVGARHPRPQRGLLTRPSGAEIIAYRAHVDAAMDRLLGLAVGRDEAAALSSLLQVGINHEQQHQELILTDILYTFSCNPLRPAYRPAEGEHRALSEASLQPLTWVDVAAGIYEIGHRGGGFAYDNEGPRHRIYLRPFKLASRATTNAEWRDFISDGGYCRADLWLSDGWAAVQAEGWTAPLYWELDGGDTRTMTLAGMQPLEAAAPVCHVSFYEADAFARWAGKRLPTEAEWEVVASTLPVRGNTLGNDVLRPLPALVGAEGDGAARQMFGDVWEWTASPYIAYPGYQPAAGAIGEYNGKFMCNQMVLRGGSCATPDGHVRASYRNFFYPWQRWQFAGLRLAEDV